MATVLLREFGQAVSVALLVVAIDLTISIRMLERLFDKGISGRLRPEERASSRTQTFLASANGVMVLLPNGDKQNYGRVKFWHMC